MLLLIYYILMKQHVIVGISVLSDNVNWVEFPRLNILSEHILQFSESVLSEKEFSVFP
jgi:hypothetical protein